MCSVILQMWWARKLADKGQIGAFSTDNTCKYYLVKWMGFPWGRRDIRKFWSTTNPNETRQTCLHRQLLWSTGESTWLVLPNRCQGCHTAQAGSHHWPEIRGISDETNLPRPWPRGLPPFDEQGKSAKRQKQEWKSKQNLNNFGRGWPSRNPRWNQMERHHGLV